MDTTLHLEIKLTADKPCTVRAYLDVSHVHENMATTAKYQLCRFK